MDWIPWSISAVSLLFVVLSFVRTGTKDRIDTLQKEQSQLDGIKESLLKANIKLDQVCATTNETRADIKALDNRLQEMDKRVTVVERDLKTAFNRIDELKGGTI